MILEKGVLGSIYIKKKNYINGDVGLGQLDESMRPCAVQFLLNGFFLSNLHNKKILRLFDNEYMLLACFSA